MTKQQVIQKFNDYKADAKAGLIKDAKALSVFDKSFMAAYDLTADMIAQYNLTMEKFLASGFKAECKTTAGGVRKTAELTTIEELRRQIGAYMDRLMLTPKTNGKIEKKEGGKLETLFAEIGKLQGSL